MATFNMLDHLDKLVPDGGVCTQLEGSFKCPVCGAKNFKVCLKTGKYYAFGCDCTAIESGKRKIREVLSPSTWQKSIRPAQQQKFAYERSVEGRTERIIQVIRDDDGQGNRRFYQQHWNGQKWMNGVPDVLKPQVHLYRIFEQVNKAARGQRICLVEGEGNVDLLLSLGIPATTAIGGAGKWKHYGHPNYLEDLQGYQVILCPDRDEPGIKHCEEVEAELLANGIKVAGWCYAFPDSYLWKRLPKSGGADMADWITDGATHKEILAAVEPKRLPVALAAPASAFEPQLLDLSQVRQQLERLVTEGVGQADIDIQIANLARASGHQPGTIHRIYQSLESDADLLTATQGAADDLEQLRTIQGQQLPIEYGLHGDGGRFASQIQQVAEAMPTAPEFLVTTLIPVLALAMGTAQTLIIHGTACYTARAIFRSIIVAQTGRKKTPAQSAILKALTTLEESAANDYTAQMADYGQEHREWFKTSKGNKDPGPEPQKPIRRRYITQDSTLAARIQIHSENPRGLLLYKDEASAFITERGRFTSGKGDGGETEADLSEFNGGAIMCDRKGDGSTFLAKTAISRVGATQFSTLQKLMGDHEDGNGEFSRYLFCAAEAPPSKIDLSKDVGDIGLTSAVMALFDKLQRLPEASYLLSTQAKSAFQHYQHELTDRQLNEDHPSLQAAYPKFETYFGRFILWLHLVNAVLAAQTPAPVVDEYTVKLARQWTEYFIGQLRLVLAANSPQQKLTGDLLRVYEYLKRKDKPLNVRTIQGGRLFARSAEKVKARSPYLKELLSTLVEQGWITQQDGLYSLSTPDVLPSVEQNIEQMLSSRKPIQQPTEQGFPGFAEQSVEKLSRLSNKSVEWIKGNSHHTHPEEFEPLTDQEYAELMGGVHANS